MMSHTLRDLIKQAFPVIAVAALGLPFISISGRSEQASSRSEQQKSAYRAAMEQADQKITRAENEHSDVVQNEEYLTTYIGPRVTGSREMQRASQWTLEMFLKYRLDAHLETTQIAHAWSRGNDWGELITPVHHWTTVRSGAWGKATPGPVTGRVLAIERTVKPADLLSNREKYKGAIVLFNEPPGRATLSPNPPNSYDAVVTTYQRELLKLPMKQLIQMFGNEQKVVDALAQAGATAMLRDSEKPYALLNMGDAGLNFEPSRLPIAYISHPDYEWLLRLAKADQGTFRINLDGKFSQGPVSATNTIAQIRGSEHPDEQVIIGGHLDSWDLGEGAVDDGTGVMAVLEAARLLKSLGWTPKRTLTFALFFGEEQGVAGSRAFVKKHATEADKIDAALIDDVGAGRITSIPLENLWSTGPLMEEIYAPLQKVFELDAISNEYFSGADHMPFLWAGVPPTCASRPRPITATPIIRTTMCSSSCSPMRSSNKLWCWPLGCERIGDARPTPAPPEAGRNRVTSRARDYDFLCAQLFSWTK